jgi:phosphoglycerol transferase MdoB-like AlkP superfamily enzyme
MLKLSKPYAFYFLFWLIYFTFARLFFITYHYEKAIQIGFSQCFNTFLYGIRLDVSMAGYLCVFPFILLAFASFFKKIQPICLKIQRFYTILMLLLLTILIVVDLELYKNWGYRLDDSFLKYLASPKEMMASSSASPVLLLLVLSILFFIIGFYLSKKAFSFSEFENDSNPLNSIQNPITLKILRGLLGIVLTCSLIIPIRGGFQLTPVNQSVVYFSNHIFANHAAINPIWNFMATVVERNKERHNPYHFFSQNEVENIAKNWLTYSDSIDYVLKKDITQPNIILITWESFTTKATKCMGNLDGVTPQFDSLVKEGILFNNIFSSGERTHLGLMATLGGQPAITGENIFENQRKTLKMPILSHDFKQNGYETGFYYGGEAAFANMKSYLLNGQFNHLITKSNFEKKDLSSKWGAFDHVVFEKSFKDLPQYKQPFFINILTLSSHEPFETPISWRGNKTTNQSDETQAFKNVMTYTDDALGQFIQECKKQNWWQNTLVIITADHGTHRLEPINDIDRYRIPVLLLGGALAKRNTIIETVGSQTDIAPTILSQLNIQHKHYRWSKNLLSKQLKPFAYFSIHNGFGFATQNTRIVFDAEGGFIYAQQGVLDSANITAGKAFLQLIYDDFLK